MEATEAKKKELAQRKAAGEDVTAEEQAMEAQEQEEQGEGEDEDDEDNEDEEGEDEEQEAGGRIFADTETDGSLTTADGAPASSMTEEELESKRELRRERLKADIAETAEAILGVCRPFVSTLLRFSVSLARSSSLPPSAFVGVSRSLFLFLLISAFLLFLFSPSVVLSDW